MTIIKADDAWKRWDTLPDEIRVAITADKTNDIVAAVAKERGIPDGKIPALARVTGYVFMGFVYVDDAARELQEALSVAAPLATQIAADLKQKLFAPYQAQLATLFTAPLSVAAVAGIPAPGSLPRVIDLGSTPLSVSTPTPAVAPIAKVAAPAVKPSAVPPAGLSFAAPAVMPAAASTPAPFIMHQEASSAPLAAGANFKLNMPADIFKQAQIKKAPVPLPPKAANLEIGSAPKPFIQPTINAQFQTKVPEARIVHYTDLRTTVAPGMAVPATPSIISAQKTPAAPLSVPPRMSMPTAPSAPAPQKTAPAPVVSFTPPSTAPAPGTTPKPPKVVNFGSEEVK